MDDKDDVEDSFFTLQLFSFSFSFVTRQLCMGRSSSMRDNNSARDVVHTMHKFVDGDVYFVALL